jgi:hypothetical protein
MDAWGWMWRDDGGYLVIGFDDKTEGRVVSKMLAVPAPFDDALGDLHRWFLRLLRPSNTPGKSVTGRLSL